MTSASNNHKTNRSKKKCSSTAFYVILVLNFLQFNSQKIIGSERLVEKNINHIDNPSNPLESNNIPNRLLIVQKLNEIDAILKSIDSLKNEIIIANGLKSENQHNYKDELLNNFEIAGFFDLRHVRNLNDNTNGGLNFGQFEIGISKSVSKLISLESAIAYNSEEGKFELGAGFIDFSIYNSGAEAKIQSGFWKNAGFMIGQFDMPFGIDYKCIAAPDRKLVTPPLANEKTINCMNNFGAAIYGETEFFDFTFWGSNGLLNNGFALGGRFGFKPLTTLELGTSYLTDLVSLNFAATKTFGADFRYEFNSLEFKCEYIAAHGIFEGEISSNGLGEKHNGYYLQITNELESLLNLPFYICLRYGSWNAGFVDDEAEFKNKINRITSGIGYRIIDGLEIRSELHSEKELNAKRTNALSLQIVASF